MQTAKNLVSTPGDPSSKFYKNTRRCVRHPATSALHDLRSKSPGDCLMRPCPYYRIWRKPVRRRPAWSSQDANQPEIKVFYCTHDESPETLEMAQKHLGSEQGLKCGGNLRRCLLPDGTKPVADRLRNDDASRLALDACIAARLEGGERDA